MRDHSIIVRALWDPEAAVWVATSDDMAGLAIEADRVEDLERKVVNAISDLLKVDGYQGQLREIPVHIIAETLTRVIVPAAA